MSDKKNPFSPDYVPVMDSIVKDNSKKITKESMRRKATRKNEPVWVDSLKKITDDERGLARRKRKASI